MSLSTMIGRGGLLAGVMLLCAMPAAAQQVYKWKDASGTTHYSEQPPPQGASKRMKLSRDDLPAPVRHDEKHAAGTDAATALDEANTRQRARMCEVAKGNVSLLKGGGMVTAGDDIHSATQLVSDQRQQALETAQADVTRYCHDQ